MQQGKCRWKWSIILIVWLGGAYLLWLVWQYQKKLNDPAGSFIEFSIMFVGTFYVLVLIPIKCGVDRLLDKFKELPDAYSR